VPLRYLLDTNIVSDLFRRPQGRVASQIATVGEATICTSIVVAAELRVRKSGSNQLGDRVDLLLSAVEVVPLEPPADRRYGEIRHRLTRQGALIGPNDLLIAAHTLALDLTLVTANTREFSRVPRLRMENWLAQ
jgi:tRNA(fMet)-specific endonuclease VapC